jgi:hypothetical protein
MGGSRSGEAKALELGELAGRLLERLMSPATLARLQAELPELGGEAIEREVSFLREHACSSRTASLMAAFWRDQPAAAS